MTHTIGMDGVEAAGDQPPKHPGRGYEHEAMFYAGDEQFVSLSTRFLDDGIAAGQPTLVVVSGHKIGLLQAALGDRASAVQFADMASVGSNPARIIPAWQEFIDAHAGNPRGMRGIGEPINPDRAGEELVECQHHESLLNVAFPPETPLRLMCPYDTRALPADVIEEALRSHPIISDGQAQESNNRFRMHDSIDGQLAASLPPRPVEALEIPLPSNAVDGLRSTVFHFARSSGLDETRAGQFSLAFHELANHSIVRALPNCRFGLWRDDASVVFEVRDTTRVIDPLAGRRKPGPDNADPRGLWLVNQLCDLVQVRSSTSGSVVRVYMHLAMSPA